MLLVETKLRILFRSRDTISCPAAYLIVLLEHRMELADLALGRAVLELFSEQTRRESILLDTGHDVELLLEVPDSLALEQDIFIRLIVPAACLSQHACDLRQSLAECSKQADSGG